MADQFTLSGSYATTPLDGVTSFQAAVNAVIDESVTLDKKNCYTAELRVDTAVAVQLGSVTEANIIILKAIGGPCKVRVTSTYGSQAPVPFDTFLILMTRDNPVTAIDLTRTPGVDTDVLVFVGQE